MSKIHGEIQLLYKVQTKKPQKWYQSRFTLVWHRLSQCFWYFKIFNFFERKLQMCVKCVMADTDFHCKNAVTNLPLCNMECFGNKGPLTIVFFLYSIIQLNLYFKTEQIVLQPVIMLHYKSMG